ncbi:hypothetical protein PIB30_036191 [Stylosanthes scabra]|uniref:Aminotransferase-like plant mobile domain-containing protein n=1 Tax=Stylosanthes scabra TaxID=79078 RepID=A0ABU6SEL1_9FABA|nr:hypothetical protein [Stylosanthes scabra]
MMPEGRRRPRWDWFREMFGEPPDAPDADSCTVTFSWLRSRFGVLPSHPTDEMVLMHARAYIWMLLSICLFGDKIGARAHVRWLPYLLCIDDLGRYSWGAGFSGGFPSFALPLSTTLSGHWPPGGIGISHIRREGAPTARS